MVWVTTASTQIAEFEDGRMIAVLPMPDGKWKLCEVRPPVGGGHASLGEARRLLEQQIFHAERDERRPRPRDAAVMRSLR